MTSRAAVLASAQRPGDHLPFGGGVDVQFPHSVVLLPVLCSQQPQCTTSSISSVCMGDRTHVADSPCHAACTWCVCHGDEQSIHFGLGNVHENHDVAFEESRSVCGISTPPPTRGPAAPSMIPSASLPVLCEWGCRSSRRLPVVGLARLSWGWRVVADGRRCW